MSIKTINATNTTTFGNSSDFNNSTPVSWESWGDIMDRLDEEDKKKEIIICTMEIITITITSVVVTMEIMSTIIRKSHFHQKYRLPTADKEIVSFTLAEHRNLLEKQRQERMAKMTPKVVIVKTKTNKTKRKRRRKQQKNTGGWKQVKKNKPKTQKKRFVNTTIILKNLPYEGVYEEDIKKMFANCGPIRFVNILRRNNDTCKGIAFVRFVEKEGSDEGIKMNGFWCGNRRVGVEYAIDKRERK